MKSLLKLVTGLVVGILALRPGFAFEPARVEVKPLKVLMIGNSFSISVMNEMPKIAAELSLPLDLCSMYIGGCSLARHVKNVKAPGTNPYYVTWSYVSVPSAEAPVCQALREAATGGPLAKGASSGQGNIPALLAADKWDFVTIQQASHESWRPESYEPSGTELIAKIRELAPQAKIIVQQTWTYTPWDGRLAAWGIDQNVMFDKLEKAYADFAAAHGLDQILTGKAVQRYRKELPVVYTEKSNDDDVCGTSTFIEKDGKWVPKGDVFHLNARGEFLQALVWTAKLFNADVTKSAYVPKSLSAHPERAVLMRRIATELK